MRTITCFVTTLLLCFLLAVPASAARETLRVAFNPLPPWKLLDDSGTPTGIDIEFLQLLARRMDVELEFVALPFRRGLAKLEQGDIDLMTGLLRRPDREQYAHFLMPPYKTKTHKAFYVRKGDEGTITKHEDLYSLSIGTQLGTKYYPRFDNDERINKTPVSDTDLSYTMLLKGRIDAFIMTEATGDYRVATKGLSDKIGKARFVYDKRQDVHFALSRLSPFSARLEEFNARLAELLEQGEFERVKNDFLDHQQNMQ